MATLTRQTFDELGTSITFSSAGVSGDKATNRDGKTVFIVKNGGGSSINVTISEQLSSNTITDPQYGKVSKADVVKAVAAGAEAIIGPFAKQAFNDSSDDVNISYSATTSITVAALTLP